MFFDLCVKEKWIVEDLDEYMLVGMKNGDFDRRGYSWFTRKEMAFQIPL